MVRRYRTVDALHDVNMLGLEGWRLHSAILDRFGDISSYIVEMVIIERNGIRK